ncbi:MAG: N-acetyltransferase [Alphaproteobacteria bacterium]|nr:N-acetyltransferase [Alphaproteobacteria bacterium]
MSAAPEGALPILVRDAGDADQEAIAAIYRHHVAAGRASFEEVAPTAAELAWRRRDITGRGLPYLVAEWDTVVHGFAYAAPYRTRSAYRFTVEDSIYVDPAAARRGIGQALLSRLIVLCTALGYRQMVAVIGDSANAGSIALHRGMGFAMVGTLPAVGFKLDQWVDSVIMQRALGAGGAGTPAEPPGAA